MGARASTISADELSRLIERVYATALSAGAWDTLLRDLTRECEGTGALIFMRDALRPDFPLARISGFDAAELLAYQDYYLARDVRLGPVSSRPVGEVVSDEILDTRSYRGSEIYNDFYARLDCGRFLAVTLERGARFNAMLAIQGSDRRAPFDHRSATVLRALTPHLVQALRIARELDTRSTLQAVGARMLDALDTGAIVLDEIGRIMLVNAEAQRIIDAKDGLELSAEGPKATSRYVDARLQARIEAVRRGSVSRTLAAPIPVLRPSGKSPYFVLVIPHDANAQALAEPRARVIVLLSDPARDRHRLVDATARLYELTAAESRLLATLLGGGSAQSHAADTGLTVSTARTYMKRLRRKMGARSQLEVLLIAHRIPAALP